MNSCGNGVVLGMFWKLLERFGVSGVQFALQIILARKLDPEHYGALALMMIFIALASIFVQGGFNTALIQNKDVDEDDYSSVFWTSLAVATALYVALFFSAPAIGSVYDMPYLVEPLRVLALMLFPGVLNSVQLAKVSREMDFKKVFYGNIGGAIVSGVVGVAAAYSGCGLWALVAQSLTNVIVVCLTMRFTVKLKLRFVYNWRRVKTLFSFGWKLLVSSLLDTLYADLRSLVIGLKYDAGTLGYYNRGKHFPQFIINAVNGAVTSVMLPAMSAEQDDKTRVKALARVSITTSAYVIFPMMAGLAAIASPLVSLLLTDKWLPCAPYMMIYCFTLAFYPVHSCNLQAINAMGRSDVFLILEIIKKTYGLVVLAIAVFYFDSPLAIAGTGLVTTWISWFVNARPNKNLLGYSYWEQVKDLTPSMFLSLAMFGVVWPLGRLPLSNLPTLIVQIIVGAAFYILASAIVKPTPYRTLTAQLKKALNKTGLNAKRDAA
ncbi:MAG: lipopolysaccharide biosynthesis protein [Thermoguttaceae bacterium]|nr:lipopolysaccharide biosynthesis protein [Thermoguttaceae bacterium]